MPLQSLLRSLFTRIRVLLVVGAVITAVCAQAQLPTTGWPRAGGNNQNSNASGGSNTTPVIQWATSILDAIDCLAVGPDGTVYAIDALNLYAMDPSDGHILWTFSGPGSSVSPPPTIGQDGTVYYSLPVSTGSNGLVYQGYLYALDGKTGAVKWVNSDYMVVTPPCIGSDGTLYVTAAKRDAPSYVTALDPKTGKALWTNTDFWVMSIALGTDGTIYGVMNSMFTIGAISPNGVTIWKEDLPSQVHGGLAIGPNGTLYIGTLDNMLYAVNSSGATLWSYQTTEGVSQSPAIDANNHIYFTGWHGGALSAIDGNTGYLLWTNPLSPADFPSTPIVDSNGVIYFGESGTVVGNLQPTLLAMDSATGNVLWSVQPNTQDSHGPDFVPVLAQDGTLYIVAEGYNGAYDPVLAFASAHATSFALPSGSVTGGSTLSATITLAHPAPANGGVLKLSSDSKAVQLPASITLAPGQTTVIVPITTSSVNASTVANLSVSPSSNLKTKLTVNPPALQSLTLNPSSVFGGQLVTGTVTIASAAPDGGEAISLSSSTVYAKVPASVTVAAGQTSAQFSISTPSVTSTKSVTLSANMGGVTESASLTINVSALSSIGLSPTTVAGGGSTIGTVSLTGPAPSSGAAIQLTSSSNAVTMPPSVTVGTGQTNAAFTVTCPVVKTSSTVTITASGGGVSKSVNLTLAPLSVSNVTVSPGKVNGGTSASGSLTLNGPAPKGGLVVTLSSSLSNAKVPGTVRVAAGEAGATFMVTTRAVATQKTATIAAKFGVAQKTSLVVNPPTLSSLKVAPSSVAGGTKATGTVSISSPAPSGGLSIKLSSSSASAIVPASVTVPAGKTSVNFSVKTAKVKATISATVTVSLGGATQTVSVTITK